MEPFKTSDTSLAAFLHYNGQEALGLMQDPNDSHRKVFVFVKTESTEDSIKEYSDGLVTLNPKLYYKSIRRMHKLLSTGELITPKY